eukprot:TRINITY_DN6842_c0_g1_i2.p1 TRINITY_DN6842_c0_g1~~TRINITY_DN6842_c0_g1_i2.p1  ORF type:complete len:146 (+),score=24.43 TRINITY_DN6842_c0_g1_i2:145-582(+)
MQTTLQTIDIQVVCEKFRLSPEHRSAWFDTLNDAQKKEVDDFWYSSIIAFFKHHLARMGFDYEELRDLMTPRQFFDFFGGSFFDDTHGKDVFTGRLMLALTLDDWFSLTETEDIPVGLLKNREDFAKRFTAMPPQQQECYRNLLR